MKPVHPAAELGQDASQTPGLLACPQNGKNHTPQRVGGAFHRSRNGISGFYPSQHLLGEARDGRLLSFHHGLQRQAQGDPRVEVHG